MKEHFGDVLDELMRQKSRTADELAKSTTLPKQTIASWREGRVKRPRNIGDILTVATSMGLTESEANRLLIAARHPPVAELQKLNRSDEDAAWGSQLAYWSSPPPPINSIFQAPPMVDMLVGRSSLHNQLVRNLQNRLHPITVLYGMGGVGKTSLATSLAYECRTYFPDGVLWANLRKAVVNNTLDGSVLRTILYSFTDTYGRLIHTEADLDSCSRIFREVMANKQALIVLDNAHGASDVQPLLPPTTGRCAVLITTRNQKPLRDTRFHAVAVAQLRDSESYNLLGQLVTDGRIRQEPDAVQRLIKMLGGLPLALKIAGSTLVDNESISISAYLQYLEDEHQRLSRLQNWDDSQKNVGSSFEVSFSHLSEKEKHLFSLLSLFDGPDFSAEAVAALIEDGSPVEMTMQLNRLKSRSLIEPGRSSSPSKARFQLHPLLQLFAREKLLTLAHPEWQLEQKLAQFFAGLAEEYAVESNHPAFAEDWENIVGSMQRALAKGLWDSSEQGIHAMTNVHLGIVGFLDAQGLWDIAEKLLHKLLDNPKLAQNELEKASVLFKLGAMAFRRAEVKLAKKYLEESLSLIRPHSPTDETAVLYHAYICNFMAQIALNESIEDALDWSMQGIELLQKVSSQHAKKEEGFLQVRHGTLLGQSGNISDAFTAVNRGMELLPQESSPARISGLMTLGVLNDIKGNFQEAVAHWQEAIKAAEAVGDKRRLAYLWLNMGIAASAQSHFSQSITYQTNALNILSDIGDIVGKVRAHSNLAYDYNLLGRFDEAQSHVDQALTDLKERNLPEGELNLLINQAQLRIAAADLPAAEIILTRAGNLCRQLTLAQQMIEILLLQAELAHLQKRYHEAIKLAKSADQLSLSTRESGRRARLLGQSWSMLNDSDAANDAFSQSRSIFCNNPYELARTNLAQGSSFLEQGHVKEAVQLIESAQNSFEQLNIPYYAETATALLQSF